MIKQGSYMNRLFHSMWNGEIKVIKVWQVSVAFRFVFIDAY